MNGETLDLRDPPPSLPIVNILGDSAGLEDEGVAQDVGERFCMWVRAGDVTGDGTTDFAVGADRRASQDDPEQQDAGAVYVFRGGSHFQISQTIDLADFGTVAVGNVFRLRPPADCDDVDGDAINCHLGATVQVSDLDDNGHCRSTGGHCAQSRWRWTAAGRR